MAAGVYNTTIEQGATFRRVLTYKDEDGAIVDLTGWNARMQLRTSKSAVSSTLALTSSPAAGITMGGVAGTVTVEITATQTAALVASTYVYDLEIYNGAEVIRLIEGSLTLSTEVTR